VSGESGMTLMLSSSGGQTGISVMWSSRGGHLVVVNQSVWFAGTA
jgi:hypothetical protein